MFSEEEILILGKNEQERRLLANLNALALIMSLPIQEWLRNQHPALKAKILRATLELPFTVLKIFWFLYRSPDIRLPSHADVTACHSMMVCMAFHNEISSLTYKPGSTQKRRVAPLWNTVALDLGSPDQLLRTGATDAIRGRDAVFSQNQTYVPAQFILANRMAVRNLVTVASSSEAIFSLERGGSLLADHLDVLLRGAVPNIKVPKFPPVMVGSASTATLSSSSSSSSSSSRPRVPSGPIYSKTEHVNRFKDLIIARIQAANAEQRPIRISIAETLVGGGSANVILKAVNDIIQRGYHAEFCLLFERHTLHGNNDLGGAFDEIPVTPITDDYGLFPISGSRLTIQKLKQTLYTAPEPVSESQLLPATSSSSSSLASPAVHPDLSHGLMSLSSHSSSSSPSPLIPPPVYVSPSRVNLFIAKSIYILGEDIDYQMSYEGPDSGNPLVVFDSVDNSVRAMCIDPARGHTARQMLIQLVQGAYDDALRQAGLL